MGTLPDRLMIRKQDGIDFVPLHNIIRLESGNERVNIFLQSGECLDVSGRIGDYETRLIDHRFFLRIHRSFLINLRYLSKLEGNKVIMSDGTEIQVSYDKYMAPLKARLEELFDWGGMFLYHKSLANMDESRPRKKGRESGFR